jgi:flagellin-like protein
MNVFKKFRKFKKNAKALSPVIATIILIAVTVAVSVVVAAWMGALTIGFMGNAEQAKITNIVLSNAAPGSNPSLNQAVVTVQNTGSSKVTITSATIDGNIATITGVPVSITKGTTADITMTILASVENFTNSAQYTINLMTAKGNTETGQATYNGP